MAPDHLPGAPTGRVSPAASGLGSLALVGLGLIWGYSWVVMKVGLRYSQPFTFAALRTFLAALILLVLLSLLRRPMRPKAIGLTCLIGLTQTTCSIGLAMWALEIGGVGRTAVLVYTMPFWLLVMVWLFRGERPQGAQWLAAVLAFGGLLLTVEPWRLHSVLSSLMALGASLSWAISAILVRALDRRNDVDLLSLTAWQTMLGSIPLVAIALATSTGPPVWSSSFIWALSYNVVIATALAGLLWFFSLRVLSANHAGFGILLVPVVGLSAAWIQLGERPSLDEAVGIALIMTALCLITVREARVGRRATLNGAPLL